jgi:hypothetical protein
MSAGLTTEFLASLEMPRPPCPVCDWPMWLWKIEPGAERATEQQMFVCPRCDHHEQRRVQRDALPAGEPAVDDR